MNQSAIALSLFTLACAGTNDSDSTDKVDEGATIEATVRVLNAMSGAGMEAVAVENATGNTESTDSSGIATISVPANSTFELLLEKESAIDHLLFGPTANENFEYITFMATEVLVSSVLSMLGATPDEGTGVVVVGIDYDDLSPAVGASASLNVDHDDPWVLNNGGAAFSDAP